MSPPQSLQSMWCMAEQDDILDRSSGVEAFCTDTDFIIHPKGVHLLSALHHVGASSIRLDSVTVLPFLGISMEEKTSWTSLLDMHAPSSARHWVVYRS